MKDANLLAGTAWARLSPGESASALTPADRAKKQACAIPSQSFEMQGGLLLGRDTIVRVSKTIYGKMVTSKDNAGTKIELYVPGSSSSPSVEIGRAHV